MHAGGAPVLRGPAAAGEVQAGAAAGAAEGGRRSGPHPLAGMRKGSRRSGPCVHAGSGGGGQARVWGGARCAPDSPPPRASARGQLPLRESPGVTPRSTASEVTRAADRAFSRHRLGEGDGPLGVGRVCREVECVTVLEEGDYLRVGEAVLGKKKLSRPDFVAVGTTSSATAGSQEHRSPTHQPPHTAHQPPRVLVRPSGAASTPARPCEVPRWWRREGERVGEARPASEVDAQPPPLGTVRPRRPFSSGVCTGRIVDVGFEVTGLSPGRLMDGRRGDSSKAPRGKAPPGPIRPVRPLHRVEGWLPGRKGKRRRRFVPGRCARLHRPKNDAAAGARKGREADARSRRFPSRRRRPPLVARRCREERLSHASGEGVAPGRRERRRRGVAERLPSRGWRRPPSMFGREGQRRGPSRPREGVEVRSAPAPVIDEDDEERPRGALGSADAGAVGDGLFRTSARWSPSSTPCLHVMST